MKYALIPPQGKLNAVRFSPAIFLTIIYLSVSIIWILMSDLIVANLSGSNNNMLHRLQEFKGIFFVLFTGILLFLLSKKLYGNMSRSYHEKEGLEEKFLALNEAAREGIFDCDLKNMTAHINHKMKFFVPASSEDVNDFWSVYQKRIHPDDISRLIKEYNEIERSLKTAWQLEYRLLGTDNKYYTVISSIYILRSPETGKPLRLIGTILDISELRNLQAEKYEQQLKYKQELAASVIRAQEKERNRWAEELHDNVCQLLTVARLYAGEMSKKPQTIEKLLPQTKQLLTDALADIRELSANIKPPSFSKSTLIQSLEKLAADINRVRDIRISFSIEKLNEMNLCDEQKLLIYRVIQEQLTNIIKYADAKKAEINIGQAEGTVTIQVKDDGKGFDPSQTKTGIGLHNIQSRLQLYKGKMNIRSASGQGCTLSAAFNI